MWSSFLQIILTTTAKERFNDMWNVDKNRVDEISVSFKVLKMETNALRYIIVKSISPKSARQLSFFKILEQVD